MKDASQVKSENASQVKSENASQVKSEEWKIKVTILRRDSPPF